MEKSKRIFELQTHTGKSVTVGDVTITPQSQAFTLRWPKGGFVWNRPLAILVERGKRTERIPVVDVTLVTLVVLLGLSLILSVAISILSVLRRSV